MSHQEISVNYDTEGKLITTLKMNAFIERHNIPQTVTFILMSAQHSSKAVAMASQHVVATGRISDTKRQKTTATTTTTTTTNEQPQPTSMMDPTFALAQLQSSEWGLWSQNGEDGILLWIFSELNMLEVSESIPRYFVEFGVEDGYECNTRILREQFHWNGLLMDGSNENITFNLKKEFITAEGINQLFDKHHVPVNLDFLSGERKKLFDFFYISLFTKIYDYGLF